MSRISPNTISRTVLLACTAMLAVILAGCPSPTPPPPGAITVSAGPDQTLTVGDIGAAGATVTGATGTVTYLWSITAPGAIIGSNTGPAVAITGSAAGAATLTVTASDSGTGTAATGTATITFVAPTPPAALAANAGPNQSVLVGEAVLLAGSATGGTPPYSFQWQQVSGPAQMIFPSNGALSGLSVTGTVPGTAVFMLTVTDGTGQMATSTVTVTVTAGPLTLTFTPGTDNLVGTPGNDTFNAPIVLVNPFGPVQTLQPTDRASGGGGQDILNAVLNGNTAGLIGPPPVLTGIQTFNLTVIGGPPFDAANVTGVTTINSQFSSVPLTVTNLSAPLTNAGIVSPTLGGGVLNLTFDAAALSGPSDVLNLTLSDVPGPAGATVIITTPPTATSSYETINIQSTAGPNVLAALPEVGGTPTLSTVNISGDAELTLNIIAGVAPPATLTINAAALTQSLIKSIPSANPLALTGGSGNDTLTGSNLADTINGGPGNDTISGLAGIDTLTLGPGADRVEIVAVGLNGLDRKIITDFDDTPTTGDVLNIVSPVITLTGTDNFATAASLQVHATAGALTVLAPTEVVKVTSGTVPNFTDANSLNGTNLLTAVGGGITTPAAGAVLLFLVADPAGEVGVYLGFSGADNIISATELTLVAVLQGPNVNISTLVFNNFSNAAS